MNNKPIGSESPRKPRFGKDDAGRIKKIAYYYGKDLFAGHKINWDQLGSSLWRQTVNRVRAYFNKDYAQLVRDEFFNSWNIASSALKRKKQSPDDKKNDVQKYLDNLMKVPSKDMPTSKKMELILKIVGNDPNLKNITPRKGGATYFNQASQYFKDIKSESLYAIHQKINSLPPISFSATFFQKQIKSEKDLQDLKMEFTRDLIDRWVENIKKAVYVPKEARINQLDKLLGEIEGFTEIERNELQAYAFVRYTKIVGIFQEKDEFDRLIKDSQIDTLHELKNVLKTRYETELMPVQEKWKNFDEILELYILELLKSEVKILEQKYPQLGSIVIVDSGNREEVFKILMNIKREGEEIEYQLKHPKQ